MTKQVFWDDVDVGHKITGYSLQIDPTRIALQVSGSQDFYPVHHDLDFAKASGHPDIFVNTGFMQGCFNRLICGWIGDDGWLKKFRMEMRRMNIPGDTMTFQGKVSKKFIEDGEHLVECELWAENEREGVTTPSFALVSLPTRSE